MNDLLERSGMFDRKNCPLRHQNGNCLAIGGFCTAVCGEICYGLLNAYDHGKNDALELLKWQTASDWVSVKDRLPKLDQEVLVYAVGKIDGFIGDSAYAICKRFIQHILPSSPGHEVWNTPWQYFHTDFEITHWMPLPEPPKEENPETD